MQNFAKMVQSGELIEHEIKTKRLEDLKPPIRSEPVKEDGEIEAIFSNPQHGGHASHSANQEPKLKKENYQLDPILMTYIELFPHLIANHFVKTVVLKPPSPPFPKWYDPTTHSEYHAGISSHSTKDCTFFKYKVQGFVR